MFNYTVCKKNQTELDQAIVEASRFIVHTHNWIWPDNFHIVLFQAGEMKTRSTGHFLCCDIWFLQIDIQS